MDLLAVSIVRVVIYMTVSVELTATASITFVLSCYLNKLYIVLGKCILLTCETDSVTQ